MDDDTDERDDSKRRSRNLSEKKRRDQFNSLVNDLSALISTSNRKMDKSTVLKSTISFLKHHNEVTDRSKVFEIQQEWKPSFLSNDEFTQLMLESLDGFIIVFGSRGSIHYTSDSVTAQLGYLPCDLLKMSIFDLAYEMDHENLVNVFLNPKPVIEPMQTDISSRNQISFFLHLKRGGIDEREINTYELVKFVGYFRNDANVDVADHNTQASLPHVLQQSNANIELDHRLIFVGTGRLQMPQMIREITVTDPTCNEFTSKHSMEWKFLFLDHRAPPIIGYMPFEVLGTSGYDYYHFDDIDNIVAGHEELMQSGKGKSSYYRFLTKGQQWIWLQTDYYISYNQFNTKPDYVVCTNKVINYEDVLRFHKPEHQPSSTQQSTKLTNNTTKASATTSLRDVGIPMPATNAGTITPTSSSAAASTRTTPNQLLTMSSTKSLTNNLNSLADMISNEHSPSMDVSTFWTNPPTPSGTSSCQQQQQQQQHLKSSSRPASSYGNISSTGISPNVKRKRYMSNCRGNDSDSTSMSADSATSRHSLMTHMSSGRQRQPLNYNNQQNSHMSHHHHQQQHHHQQHHSHQQHLHQTNNNSQAHGHAHGPKIFQALPQHAIVTGAQLTSSAPCQFTQPTFSTRSPQVVAPTFLESTQYLTAIPMQPVIAPFPVTPVISPLPNHTDMLAAPVVMTSSQSHLQEQLQRKHDELQKLIIQQQDELRIVSEQLLLARYTLLQPMMPMNYGPTEAVAMSNTSRNFNFNNSVQQQFNQYGFAMNQEEMQNQQTMLLHQQNLQQQLQHNQAQQHRQEQQHPQLQNNQNVQSANIPESPQQQLQQQHQHDPMLLNRNTESDLDQFAQEEFDAFLNLSPLQNIDGSQNALNHINAGASANIPNTSATNNHNHPNDNTTPLDNSNNPGTASEDSLFSYMQMAAETSPTLNFNMTINDGVANAPDEQSKILNNGMPDQMTKVQASQPTTPLQPSQRSPFFSSLPFVNLEPAVPVRTSSASNINISNTSVTQSVINNNNETSTLSSQLNTMLPYQLGSEQSQNIFRSNASRTNP